MQGRRAANTCWHPAGIEPYENANEFLIFPGNDDVEHGRRGRSEQSYAKCADRHPRACGQLEILSEPPIEFDPLVGVCGINEANSVSRLVKCILIECFGREIGTLPIAGGHVWAAYPHFELARRPAQA